MATSDTLWRTKLTKPHHIGIEQPDSSWSGHGQNRSLCLKNQELSRMYVHPHRTDSTFLSVYCLREQSGRFCAVVNSHPDTLQLFFQSWLKRRTPNTQGEFILIVVGKHQLRLIISEFGSLELIFRISDLSSVGLYIQHSVIAFPTGDIMSDSVGVIILFFHVSLCDFLRSHLRTRVRAG